MSRPYKYEVHTLVTGPFKGVGVVDRNTGAESKGEEEFCMVRIRSHGETVIMGYHESVLRRITRLHYFGYVHPDRGTLHVGKTPGLEWWGQFVVSLFVAWAAFGWVRDGDYAWDVAARWILCGIAAFRIFTLIYGTLRNYNDKQA